MEHIKVFTAGYPGFYEDEYCDWGDYDFTKESWNTSGLWTIHSASGESCGQEDEVEDYTEQREVPFSYPFPGNAGNHWFAEYNGAWDDSLNYLEGTQYQKILFYVTCHLKTGGKATISRKNLFTMSASADRKRNDISLDHVETIPPQSIRLMGKWLGADGLLHIALPDNDDYDITPNAPARNYSFGVEAQKHKTRLFANTTELDPDKSKLEVCVGQNVIFSLQFDPPVAYIANDVISNWKIPDKFVNESWQHTRPDSSFPNLQVAYGSLNYRINNNLLKNTLSTSCWFVNAPGAKTVSIGANLRFSNGQTVGLASIGKFQLHRPQVRKLPSSWYSNAGPAMNLAAPASMALTDDAMQFWLQIESDFPGDADYVQLVTSATRSDIAFRSSGIDDLDNTLPYGETFPINTNNWGMTWLRDGPESVGELYHVQYDGSFKSYLRFKPVGGISITLGRVDWNWNAQANWINGHWVIQPMGCPPPNFSPDDTFPEWLDVYHN